MYLAYEQFLNILNSKKLELQFIFENNEYWIIVNDYFRFLGNKEGVKIFNTSTELLNARLIEDKKLIDIWNNIDIVGFDYGWSKTINIRNKKLF